MLEAAKIKHGKHWLLMKEYIEQVLDLDWF